MKNQHKGLTFYIIFGKYSGFNVSKVGPFYRIVLGYLCIALGFTDLERDLVKADYENRRLRKNLENSLDHVLNELRKSQKELYQIKRIQRQVEKGLKHGQ